MTIPVVLKLLFLVVGLPLNVYVTVKLWRLSRAKPYIGVLRERAILAVFVMLVLLVFGVIFVNNDLAVPLVSFEDSKIFTRGALLGLAIIPASYWLYLYR